MKRTTNNAFICGDAAGASGTTFTRLRPFQATLETDRLESDQIAALKITPARLIDLLPVWRRFSPSAGSWTFVSSPDVIQWMKAGERMKLGGSIHRGDSIDVEAAFEDLGIVLDDVGLDRLAHWSSIATCRAVRIQGPVERLDATFMAGAVERGSSPLDAELRAVAAATLTDDRCIELHVRHVDHAIVFVGEMFRHYLAALLDEPVGGFSSPPLWQLQRLFEINSCVSVRPVESEVFSTSVDIGVCTEPWRDSRPAVYSLIYDRPSGTWHDTD